MCGVSLNLFFAYGAIGAHIFFFFLVFSSMSSIPVFFSLKVRTLFCATTSSVGGEAYVQKTGGNPENLITERLVDYQRNYKH